MQFTQILDILQLVLKLKFLVLTGSTPLDVRQMLVDEFAEDQSIPVFLLSTKAGGNPMLLNYGTKFDMTLFFQA